MKFMKKIILLSLILILNNVMQAQNWQAISSAPTSWRFDEMYFLNPQKGWAINPVYNYLSPAQSGGVFTTNDGGASWQKIFDSSKTFIRL
jgi:photosystem II stability/assembly factor-like uncharacterized protein